MRTLKWHDSAEPRTGRAGKPHLRDAMLPDCQQSGNQAIDCFPCFVKRSVIASTNSASVVVSRSTARPLSCLCMAGSSVAVTFFFPARVAA